MHRVMLRCFAGCHEIFNDITPASETGDILKLVTWEALSPVRQPGATNATLSISSNVGFRCRRWADHYCTDAFSRLPLRRASEIRSHSHAQGHPIKYFPCIHCTQPALCPYKPTNMIRLMSKVLRAACSTAQKQSCSTQTSSCLK